MALFQAKIGWIRKIKGENKSCRSVPFRSVPTRRVIENSKKIANKLKKLKNTVMDSFQAKIGRKRQRKIENKNYRFVFVPNRREIENSKK